LVGFGWGAGYQSRADFKVFGRVEGLAASSSNQHLPLPTRLRGLQTRAARACMRASHLVDAHQVARPERVGVHQPHYRQEDGLARGGLEHHALAWVQGGGWVGGLGRGFKRQAAASAAASAALLNAKLLHLPLLLLLCCRR